MRALFVAPYLPTPGSGGRTRLIELMRGLGRDHELALVAFPADDQAGEEPGYPGTVVARPPLRPRPGGVAGSLRFYADRLDPLPSYALWARSDAMRRAIRAEVARFRPQVVQVETTEMGQYLRDVAAGPATVLDLQDVASRWFAHTVAKRAQTAKQRALMRLELVKTRRYERAIARRPDAVLATSADERATVRAVAGVDPVEVPNGVDTAAFVPMPEEAEAPDRILFVGPMTYDANLDGLRWFVEEILPRVRAARPTASLDVVGDPAGHSFGEAVTWHGRVPDVRPFLARAPVSVVPVRLASGTRYKILEALAMERAVVSTTLGADGLGLTDGRHLAIADDAGAFAQRILALLADPVGRSALGAAGREAIVARFDWGPIVGAVSEVWDRVAAPGG